MATRGRAVQTYASLEGSLCLTFGQLAGTSMDIAAIIFYRIVNTRSRNAILSKLIKKRYKDQYSLFWNSLIAGIQILDQKRNEIIHWHIKIGVHVSEVGTTQTDIALIPPNFWDFDANSPQITKEDMIEFMWKCDFYSRAVGMFTMFVMGHLDDSPKLQTWREIFLQPLTYPPPDTHPLFRSEKERKAPPPA